MVKEPPVLWVILNQCSIPMLSAVIQDVGFPLTDPVTSAFIQRLRMENFCYRAMVRMQDQILCAGRYIEWLEMDNGPMGVDNNDIWDWDGIMSSLLMPL